MGDFGVAKHLASDSEKVEGSEGTVYFMSPECVSTKGGYDPKASDVWSLGVTYYCIAYLSLPFYKHSIIEVFEAINTQA